jgi:hypothetical protein
MSAQRYESVDVVLDDSMEATCTATAASATMLWKCASVFHGDKLHYFVRVV